MEDIEKLKDNISKGLIEQLNKHNLNQKELADILKVDNSTVGKWISKLSIPRMGIIQKLADYFKVEKSYFLEGKKEEYYLDEEVRKLAQEIFDNKELRMLFDASRKVSREDLKIAIEMIKRMKSEGQ